MSYGAVWCVLSNNTSLSTGSCGLRTANARLGSYSAMFTEFCWLPSWKYLCDQALSLKEVREQRGQQKFLQGIKRSVYSHGELWWTITLWLWIYGKVTALWWWLCLRAQGSRAWTVWWQQLNCEILCSLVCHWARVLWWILIAADGIAVCVDAAPVSTGPRANLDLWWTHSAIGIVFESSYWYCNTL